MAWRGARAALLLAAAALLLAAAAVLLAAAADGGARAPQRQQPWARRLADDGVCMAGGAALLARVGTPRHAASKGYPPVAGETATDASLIVNIGQGTTGTREITGMLQRYAPGVHFKRHQGVPRPEAVEELRYVYSTIKRCAKSDASTLNAIVRKQCSASELVPRIDAVLRSALASGAAHLSDVPYSYFKREIAALAPNARLLHSLREPLSWVRNRLHHANEPICAPPWGENASSWFAMRECLEAAGDGASAWQTLEDALGPENDAGRYDELAAKYAADVAYARSVVPPERLREICVWDDGLEALVGVRVHTDDGRGGTVERSAVEEVAQMRAWIMAKREAKKALKEGM